MDLPVRAEAITIATVLYLVFGGAGAVGTALTTRYIVLNRELPVVFGIRFMGGGFIERWGINALIALGLAWVGIDLLNILTGYWLWNQMKIGGILALVLFPFEMFLAGGFLAVVPIVLFPVRLVLVLVGWSSLTW